MKTERPIDIEAIQHNPADRFATPQQVVDDPSLTAHQKRQILLQWEQDARALATADDEGMAGGRESMLRSVMIALEAVGTEEGDPHPKSRSSGQ